MLGAVTWHGEATISAPAHASSAREEHGRLITQDSPAKDEDALPGSGDASVHGGHTDGGGRAGCATRRDDAEAHLRGPRRARVGAADAAGAVSFAAVYYSL